MQENKFGFAEIVDTVGDMALAEFEANKEFAGKKFDLIKFLTFSLGRYSTLKEAYEDWPTFTKEVGDLTPEESMQAVEAVNAKLSDEVKAKSRLYRVFLFAAFGYKNTNTVVELGKEQLALGAAIFAK